MPRTSDYVGFARGWRADVLAGATVGVVALPLALAFGVTSGLGARAGLITAIIAGVVAGIFGGSNVQVSGPTGAMTVVLAPIVLRYGADAVLLVGLIAGVLLVAAALTGLGRSVAHLPWPVVEGFTVGIALIIFLQQIPAALGVPKPHGENAAAVAIKAIGDALRDGHLDALALVVLVAAVMLVVQRVRRSLPGSLIAVALATVVAEVADLDVGVIGQIPRSLPLPSLPAISTSRVSELFGAALAVAALAAIESLLSAKVADGMADSAAHEPDRELFGQGLANLVVPLFGGMPATGAIARTAVNVRAGARTRAASIVHALVLTIVVLFGGDLVSRIPLAALAGVLMMTAIRMIEIHNVRSILRATRSDAVVLILTALATLAFDLVVAVEAGVVVASLLALRAVARTSSAEIVALPMVEVDGVLEDALLHEHIVTYRLDGALFFGAAQRFLTELTAIADVEVVILRLPQVQMLDATGAQALGGIVEDLERRNITVLLKGPRAEHVRVLREVGALDGLSHVSHLFSALDDAVDHARTHLRRSLDASGNASGIGGT